MRKKIIVVFCCILLLSGCFSKKKEKELDLDKLSNALQSLTMEQLDYKKFSSALEKDLHSFKIYDADEIAQKLEITEEMYENIFFSESIEDIQVYFIIEPKKEKEDMIKEKMNIYWNSIIENLEDEEKKQIYQERLEQDYQGNLIYIVGKDQTKKLEIIKKTKVELFPNMMKLKWNDFESMLGIKTNEIENWTFAITNKLDKVEQYLIVKSKKNTNVRQKIHDYFENLESEWKEKDKDTYEMIKNRMEQQIDDYFIYFVSKDNQKAFEIIKESNK